MDLKISTRPALERCFGPLMANSRAQLRIILIRTMNGNWRKNSSMRPGGNGVVEVEVVVAVVVVVVVVGGGGAVVVGRGDAVGEVFMIRGDWVDREASKLVMMMVMGSCWCRG